MWTRLHAREVVVGVTGVEVIIHLEALTCGAIAVTCPVTSGWCLVALRSFERSWGRGLNGFFG